MIFFNFYSNEVFFTNFTIDRIDSFDFSNYNESNFCIANEINNRNFLYKFLNNKKKDLYTHWYRRNEIH